MSADPDQAYLAVRESRAARVSSDCRSWAVIAPVDHLLAELLPIVAGGKGGVRRSGGFRRIVVDELVGDDLVPRDVQADGEGLLAIVTSSGPLMQSLRVLVVFAHVGIGKILESHADLLERVRWRSTRATR